MEAQFGFLFAAWSEPCVCVFAESLQFSIRGPAEFSSPTGVRAYIPTGGWSIRSGAKGNRFRQFIQIEEYNGMVRAIGRSISSSSSSLPRFDVSRYANEFFRIEYAINGSGFRKISICYTVAWNQNRVEKSTRNILESGLVFIRSGYDNLTVKVCMLKSVSQYHAYKIIIAN